MNYGAVPIIKQGPLPGLQNVYFRFVSNIFCQAALLSSKDNDAYYRELHGHHISSCTVLERQAAFHTMVTEPLQPHPSQCQSYLCSHLNFEKLNVFCYIFKADVFQNCVNEILYYSNCSAEQDSIDYRIQMC